MLFSWAKCIQLHCNILFVCFPDVYLGNTWVYSTFHNPLFLTESHQVQSIVAAPRWTKSAWPSLGVCVTFHPALPRPSSAWQELSDSPRKPKSESASQTEASPRWWDETDLQPPAMYLHIELQVSSSSFGLLPFFQDNADFFYIDVWSSRFTWGGLSPPEKGTFAVITKGQTILLDTSTPVLKMLLIQGKFPTRPLSSANHMSHIFSLKRYFTLCNFYISRWDAGVRWSGHRVAGREHPDHRRRAASDWPGGGTFPAQSHYHPSWKPALTWTSCLWSQDPGCQRRSPGHAWFVTHRGAFKKDIWIAAKMIFNSSGTVVELYKKKERVVLVVKVKVVVKV